MPLNESLVIYSP